MTYYESLLKLYTDTDNYQDAIELKNAHTNGLQYNMCIKIPCSICPHSNVKGSECYKGLIESLNTQVPIDNEEYKLAYEIQKRLLLEQTYESEYLEDN